MTDAASVPADAPQAADGTSVAPPAPPDRERPEDPTSPGSASPPTGLDGAGRPWPPFAHGSEAEMARILDFYAVRWDYEPQTFPILWNLDGDVVESFSPDFYLPDLDLYLEMTTLKQRLVRKKNRKLRRLRELYPDIRIKLFYARDFRAMMLKYGRLALADSLSGTLGQVMPDRLRDDEEIDGPILADAGADLPNVLIVPARYLPEASPSGAPAVPALAPQVEVAAEAGETARGSEPTGGAEPSSRRNASRSRRRRAAAAARRASRSTDAATANATRGGTGDEEDQSRR